MPPNTTLDNAVLSAQQIKPESSLRKVKEVRKEILYQNNFYDVTTFMKKHPGGRIIEFYTQNGEDATIPIQQFHHRSISKITAIMSSLPKRPARGLDMRGSELDPLQKKRHRALTEDFNKLFIQLEKEGYFNPSLYHVAYRIVELLTLMTLGLYLIKSDLIIFKLIGIISYSLFCGRCGWFEHEGGHHSLTGRPKVDRWLQMVFIGYSCSLSSSYWSNTHNKHHAMPQRLQRDIDLETMPLLAFNTKVVRNSKPNFFIKYQAFLFLPIDVLLVAFFWRIYLHPRYAIKNGKYGQLFWMAIHYWVPFYMGPWIYMACIWCTSAYMFGNFALSHTHLEVTDRPLHWIEYALEHTIDIELSWWCDWFMGYLNCQIEHHLFPTMPQFRNRFIKRRVKALAEKHGIKYQSCSYWTAIKKTFHNLNHVSHELRTRG